MFKDTRLTRAHPRCPNDYEKDILIILDTINDLMGSTVFGYATEVLAFFGNNSNGVTPEEVFGSMVNRTIRFDTGKPILVKGQIRWYID